VGELGRGGGFSLGGAVLAGMGSTARPYTALHERVVGCNDLLGRAPTLLHPP